MGSDVSTVTFTTAPPKGWIGYCSTDGCNGLNGEGETPVGIYLNWEYSTSTNYFVYYLTWDAFQEGAKEYAIEETVSEVSIWYYEYFAWTLIVDTSTAEVGGDAIYAILQAVLASKDTPPALTVTLLWHAVVDLDLYLSCPDASEVGYGANPTCDGQVDLDNTASHYNNIRGDDSEGQTENISLGSA